LYGIDHNLARFEAATVAQLRPETAIPNLFLTGQDVFTCGFVGAMFGGLLCASAVMQRNLFTDLLAAKAANTKQTPKAKSD
jgi:all-trans-retinol 13,14-reductase